MKKLVLIQLVLTLFVLFRNTKVMYKRKIRLKIDIKKINKSISNPCKTLKYEHTL